MDSIQNTFINEPWWFIVFPKPGLLAIGPVEKRNLPPLQKHSLLIGLHYDSEYFLTRADDPTHSQLNLAHKSWNRKREK